MKLREILREMWVGSRPWDKVRLVCIVIVLSPAILGIYLGMWADGYLEKRK